MQQTVLQRRAFDFDALGEQEGLLELARRNAAVDVEPLFGVRLPAAHDELVFFKPYVEIVDRESGDRERALFKMISGRFH